MSVRLPRQLAIILTMLLLPGFAAAQLGCELGADDVRTIAPDVAIVAVGARRALPTIPGVERDQFYVQVSLVDGTSIGAAEAAAMRVDAVLRAQEIHAEILLKATKVDGIYDSDPLVKKDAKFIREISYMEVIEKQLHVMDMTAISLAMDNHLPLVVFNLGNKGNIKKVVCGEVVGTQINN